MNIGVKENFAAMSRMHPATRSMSASRSPNGQVGADGDTSQKTSRAKEACRFLTRDAASELRNLNLADSKNRHHQEHSATSKVVRASQAALGTTMIVVEELAHVLSRRRVGQLLRDTPPNCGGTITTGKRQRTRVSGRRLSRRLTPFW